MRASACGHELSTAQATAAASGYFGNGTSAAPTHAVRVERVDNARLRFRLAATHDLQRAVGAHANRWLRLNPLAELRAFLGFSQRPIGPWLGHAT